MSETRPPRNPFFPATAAFGALFAITILALIAALFGDPNAPMAKLLDRFVGWMLAAEVVGLLVTGFLALAVDRRQTLAGRAPSNQAAAQPSRVGEPTPPAPGNASPETQMGTRADIPGASPESLEH